MVDMSKRKSKKKRNLSSRAAMVKPAAVAAGAAAASVAATEVATAPTSATKPKTQPAGQWSYVGRDVRRIGVLALAGAAIQLALLYLFNHTGLGSSVYSLIKI